MAFKNSRPLNTIKTIANSPNSSPSPFFSTFSHWSTRKYLTIMRHGVYYAPLPLLPPIPSPSPLPGAAANDHAMLASVFLALFLPCAGMSAVFMVYIFLLWYASSHNQRSYRSRGKPVVVQGLSTSELEKLPKVTGKELVLGTECAVCLDEIENEQPARLVPGCNHGFHLQCADTWLSKHSACPVCRAKLDAQFFGALENPC